MRLHGRQQRRSEHPSQHALQPRPPGMVLLRNASWSCNGCTDLAMQILHDDDDDDDGEVYFSGKRSVKRSRCPRSHGWRSRRLKSAASVRQAGQCVQTFGHCWKRPLKAKERRNVGQEAQSCTTPATHQRCPQRQTRFSVSHSPELQWQHSCVQRFPIVADTFHLGSTL